MRFIHKDSKNICEYFELQPSSLFMISIDGSRIERINNIDIIDKTLSESQTLWGSNLPYYICVAERGVDIRKQPATLAFSDVENENSNIEFLLFGYQDGGLISVSRDMLPFQRSAEPAEWWYPT